MTEPGARCAVHPEAEAVLTCSRCGCFACTACKSESPELCATCHRRPAERLHASRRAKLAFALSVLALHGLVPLAFAALWLHGRETAAIAAHAAPRGGAPWLTGTRWVSFAALAAWAIIGGVIASR